MKSPSPVFVALLLAACSGSSQNRGAALEPGSSQPAVAVRSARPAIAALLRSNGAAEGSAWRLQDNGYVGAYFRVDEKGTVRFAVDATAAAASGVPPQVRLSFADASVAHEAAPATLLPPLERALEPGTYFARVDFSRAAPGDTLAVRELVLEGARWLDGALDRLALDAADTFIQQHRRGRATFALPAAWAGRTARVRLERHAFGFGANVPYAENRLIPEGPLDEGATSFQRILLDHFNWVVLSNGGKWLYHEPERDQVNLGYVDRFLDFAEEHGLVARMHTLIWDTEQQPAWVVSRDPAAPGLLTRAHAGDEAAKRELIEEIDERIDDYVRKRAARYQELDVLNESLHRPRYFEVLGEDGLAALFERTKAAAGPGTRLYLNEYNLLQFSTDPRAEDKTPDPYANWYRWHAEALLRRGAPIDGLGVQYYADGRLPEELGDNAHSPARIAGVLHNLAGTGLRLTLTEFAVVPGQLPQERAADVLEHTLRLVFGMPGTDAFLMWAVWGGAAQTPPPLSILFDAEGNITPAGRRYQALMREWSTDETLVVPESGALELVGFYGDYRVTVDGESRCFSLSPPAGGGVGKAVAAPSACRGKR